MVSCRELPFSLLAFWYSTTSKTNDLPTFIFETQTPRFLLKISFSDRRKFNAAAFIPVTEGMGNKLALSLLLATLEFEDSLDNLALLMVQSRGHVDIMGTKFYLLFSHRIKLASSCFPVDPSSNFKYVFFNHLQFCWFQFKLFVSG